MNTLREYSCQFVRFVAYKIAIQEFWRIPVPSLKLQPYDAEPFGVYSVPIASLMPANEIYSGLLIGTSFLALLGIAEFCRYRLNWSVEWTRKLVHFGGGLICLSFPYLLTSHWIVLALASSMAVLFLASRRLGWLQSVHGIERSSRGSEYYPVVIYILFLLAGSMAWKYVICVLVLSVADSAAAIVGTRIGRLKFRVEDEQKSIEGSLAFFLSTLIVVLVPLLYFQPAIETLVAPYWHYTLASILIAALVTGFEAVSNKGRDNLFIPLGTLLVLTKTFQTDAADLARQNVSFLLIVLSIVTLSKLSRTFHTGGALVLCLASYGCWAMGSFDWALPVFIGYGLYVLVTMSSNFPWQLTIRPVVMNALVPFAILAIGNIGLNYGAPDVTQFCFGPFLAACCVSLAQAIFNVSMARLKGRGAAESLGRQVMIVAFLSAVFCFLLLTMPLVWRMAFYQMSTLAWIGGSVIGMSLLSAVFVGAAIPSEAPTSWYYRRMAISALAGGLIAGLQLIQWSEIWPV